MLNTHSPENPLRDPSLCDTSDAGRITNLTRIVCASLVVHNILLDEVQRALRGIVDNDMYAVVDSLREIIRGFETYDDVARNGRLVFGDPDVNLNAPFPGM